MLLAFEQYWKICLSPNSVGSKVILLVYNVICSTLQQAFHEFIVYLIVIFHYDIGQRVYVSEENV